jgi:hypothetical protein
MSANRIKLVALFAAAAGGSLAVAAAFLAVLFGATTLFELLFAAGGTFLFVFFSVPIIAAIRRKARVEQMLIVYPVMCIVFPLVFLPERYHPSPVQGQEGLITMATIVAGGVLLRFARWWKKSPPTS